MEIVPVSESFDLQKMCRTCLNENISGSYLSLYQNASLSSFLELILNKKVFKGDGFPEVICSRCKMQLENAFKFTQKCKTSDNILKYRYMNQSNIINDENSRTDILEECNSSVFSSNHLDFDDLKKDLVENGSKEFRNHSTSKSKYNCEYCDSSFSNKSKLRFHIRIHNTENEFKCEHCSQTFSKLSHLKAHKRCHEDTDDKKFACMKCEQRFSYLYLLKQHELKHTTEKPFSCTECPKGNPKTLHERKWRLPLLLGGRRFFWKHLRSLFHFEEVIKLNDSV